MIEWVEYKYPKLKMPMTGVLDETSPGLTSMTVGGFLKTLEESGQLEDFDLDSVNIQLSIGWMAKLFGSPEIRVGSHDEIFGEK